MTWDSVPWMIGGGAEHSVETARLLAYVAGGGAEGIVSPGDCKVTALETPGGNVNVSTGAVSINARNRVGQAYMGRNPTQDTIAIPPTSSAGERSDLIVARVEDPYVSGSTWPAPADPKIGPYIFTRRIESVPVGTTDVDQLNLDYDAIALARIDIPVSTSAITGAMIVDLRQVAQPRRLRHLFRHTPASEQTLPRLETFSHWPSYEPTFYVPKWATHVVATMTAHGVWKAGAASGAGHAIGDLTIEYCVPGQGNPIFAIGTNVFEEESETGNRRFTMGVSGEKYLEPQYRGLTRSIRIGARMNPTYSGADAVIKAYPTTNFVIDVEFQERAV